jgi:hypothetical protein
MKGGKARTACFNTSGMECTIWKSKAAKITIVGNTAAMPVQEKSKSECAEEPEWLWLGVACMWSSGTV